MNQTDKQLTQKAKQLARKECANLMDGTCVEYDEPCFLISPKYDSIHDGVIDCDYFLLAVLPLQPDLQKAIWAEVYSEDGTVSSVMKNCAICGKTFIPTSNRQKFCSDCKLYADRARGREKQRRYASSQKTRHESDRLDPSESP